MEKDQDNLTIEDEIKLTPKQEIFIAEYVKDFNATKAAKEAGYSDKTAAVIGSENLRKPYIVIEIRKRVQEILNDIDIDALQIYKELKTIALSDVKEHLSFDENGEFQGIDINKNNDLRVIRSIETTDNILKSKIKEDEIILDRKIKLQFYDKIKSLELLAKITKLAKDELTITGLIDFRTIPASQIKVEDLDNSKGS